MERNLMLSMKGKKKLVSMKIRQSLETAALTLFFMGISATFFCVFIWLYFHLNLPELQASALEAIVWCVIITLGSYFAINICSALDLKAEDLMHT